MNCFFAENSCGKDRESFIRSVLEKAVKNGAFKVLYQPVFEMKSEKFIAAEALVRLNDEKFGDIMPSEFIPVAEKYGFIDGIGEWVFKSVCKFFASNRLCEFGVSYIEVNLSVLQCAEKGLANRFIAIMREYGVNAKHINFEITESVSVEDGTVMLDNIRALKSAGATFAADDFGAGFSDIEHLSILPVDVVKIDKSILWNAMKNTENREKLKEIIEMFHARGLKTVAEGVESKEMADLLKTLCCEFCQGYLFSRPLTENEYLKFVKNV